VEGDKRKKNFRTRAEVAKGSYGEMQKCEGESESKRCERKRDRESER